MAAPGMPDPEVKGSEAAVEADDSFSAEVVDLLVVEGEEVVELQLEGGVVVMGLIGLVLLVAAVEGQ